MKLNISILGSLFFFTIFCSSSYGRDFDLIDPSHSIFSNEKIIIYCPSEIECMNDGQLRSCKIKDNTQDFWKIYDQEGNVKKGVYKLKNVKNFCNYNQIEGHIERFILVTMGERLSHNKFKPFLDNDTNQWYIIGNHAECLSDDPQLCPFIETGDLAYYSDIWAIDGSDPISFFVTSSPSARVKSMSYNSLIQICGATPSCNITVSQYDADKPFTAGTLTLDLTKPNLVKLLNINQNPSSHCIMTKEVPFNTIFCKRK